MIMKADASDVEHGFCILDMWRERTLQFAAVQRREQDPAPPRRARRAPRCMAHAQAKLLKRP